MLGAIPHLPHTSSWSGDYVSTEYIFMARYLVKHVDNFIFSLLPFFLFNHSYIHLFIYSYHLSLHP